MHNDKNTDETQTEYFKSAYPKSKKTKKDDPKRANNYCIHLLARREYSQRELTEKLRKAGHKAETIDQCLSQLIENNYQSDTRFAEMFTRTRVLQRYGAKKIRYELMQKGITDSVISSELKQYSDTFLDNAQSLILKKIGRASVKSLLKDRKNKDKITRFLVGRGYDYEIIHLAFEIVVASDDSCE